jgi:phosphoribosylformylglycinamidine synthase subunit PurQ / glutaminase
MTRPKVAILTTDGTNCDEETFFAFHLAGAKPCKVHLNSLIENNDTLENYQILALPGGFSYGDDVLSAKILANQLLYRLGDMINTFVERDTLIIGICNGFQALLRMGLLPWRMGPAQDCSLIYNDSGKFECRWVKLHAPSSSCVFTQGLEGKTVEFPVAHGEGKFIVKDETVMKQLNEKSLISFQYADSKGEPTDNYPANPNGSINAIAGICNETGRIFGLMPHPERYVQKTRHPRWRRYVDDMGPDGLTLFDNAVTYFS